MIDQYISSLLSGIAELKGIVEYQKLFCVRGFKKPDQPTLDYLGEKIQRCTRCDLNAERKEIVSEGGNPEADLMFVEDTPDIGKKSDILNLLIKILNAMGLKREDIFITSLIKCQPEYKKEPSQEEAACCEQFLSQQIDIIKPKVICIIGTLASQVLLNTCKSISRLRGKLYNYKNIKVMPTYHPELLLKNSDKKRDVWEDMKRIRAIINT